MKNDPNIQAPRRVGAFTLGPFVLFVALLVLMFWGITQWEAHRLGFQAELGACWFSVGRICFYHPWSFIPWGYSYWYYAPDLFGAGYTAAMIAAAAATIAYLVRAVWLARKARIASSHGSAVWAVPADYPVAGLTGPTGVVLGLSPRGEYLRDDGAEHVACVAPTRSGKGIGQVIPTLLTWPGSVLVHDMKGENWALTAGYRATFSNPIYFAPTDPETSAHWNPLLEVRNDENQIRDVQNIADQVVDPHGRGKESHWDRTADQFFLAVILHVLHAEADKSLYGVAQFLSDPNRSFEQTLLKMKNTPHKSAMAHERIASGAQAMFNKSDEERGGVLSTALAFLGLYADPIIARNTQDSDFRISDLRQGTAPMSLYIVIPDSDRLRLIPFTRLMITMFTQRLVEKMNPVENKHRLLMLIDEFPRLGRMQFFADALSHIASYGIKVMLIMQSIGQLDAPEAYGIGNTVMASCKTRAVMTPQDPRTAEWISGELGPTTDVHQQATYTGHRLAPWLGHVMVADQESARPLLDPAEVGKMPATDMIVLVSGHRPFRAKRLKYFEVPELASRAATPAPKLTKARPYAYRPAPKPVPWTAVIEPPAPPAAAKKPKRSESKGPVPGRSLSMESGGAEAEADIARARPPEDGGEEEGGEQEIAMDEAARRRALDERQEHTRHRSRHRGVS